MAKMTPKQEQWLLAHPDREWAPKVETQCPQCGKPGWSRQYTGQAPWTKGQEWVRAVVCGSKQCSVNGGRYLSKAAPKPAPQGVPSWS